MMIAIRFATILVATHESARTGGETRVGPGQELMGRPGFQGLGNILCKMPSASCFCSIFVFKCREHVLCLEASVLRVEQALACRSLSKQFASFQAKAKVHLQDCGDLIYSLRFMSCLSGDQKHCCEGSPGQSGADCEGVHPESASKHGRQADSRTPSLRGHGSAKSQLN